MGNVVARVRGKSSARKGLKTYLLSQGLRCVAGKVLRLGELRRGGGKS